MGQARRPVPERLPAKLLQIRTQLGLTQEQMAERLKHVKSPPQPGMVSRYETGQREPTLLVLLEYARMAGVTIEVLVDDKLHLPEKLRGATKSERDRKK
jgi:transcriptional regulator with XRE-family HTH domain